MNYFDTVRWKQVSRIQGFEKFTDYIVTVDGDVFSIKGGKYAKKLKLGWAKEKGKYFTVTLCARNNKPKKVYVHRLVSLAFLDTDDTSRYVFRKEGVSNNVENLQWLIPSTIPIANDDLLEKCKIVREATIRKGLNLPCENIFIEQMITLGLEDHIQKYGLRKLLHEKGI